MKGEGAERRGEGKGKGKGNGNGRGREGNRKEEGHLALLRGELGLEVPDLLHHLELVIFHRGGKTESTQGEKHHHQNHTLSCWQRGGRWRKGGSKSKEKGEGR